MIKISTSGIGALPLEHTLIPTIFPDGTSQIWHLPTWVLDATNLKIVWNFEAEREIIDLYSLKLLLNPYAFVNLHIPFLPYARQDKDIDNESTFNLSAFSILLNQLSFDRVTSVDVHNVNKTITFIYNFDNMRSEPFIRMSIEDFDPDFLVYPDTGAKNRYDLSFDRKITFEKTRDQSTGHILGHNIIGATPKVLPDNKLLLVDDLADGGATFISIAQQIRKIEPHVTIGLYVTHGVFSKGRQHLLDNGIDKIYTTNSLLKNTDGYKV